MRFLKRMLFYTLAVLLLLSLYMDLNKDQPIQKDSRIFHESSNIEDVEPFKAVRKKVKAGENFLTIVEEVNPHIFDELTIDQVIEDFKKLNPKVDPYALELQQYYYFPLY